jgi:hypothetical protein
MFYFYTHLNKLNMKKFYNLNPVATYDNAKVSKKQIMQENKGLSGVYCWTNKINGKTYIGSSEKLNRRLACYFSVPKNIWRLY